MASNRTTIDRMLDQALPPLGSCPDALHEALRYTLLLPGKRVRGILLLASCAFLKARRRMRFLWPAPWRWFTPLP